MSLSRELASDVAQFLEYRPFLHEPELPAYVDYHVVQDRVTGELFCKQRHPMLVSAACLIEQCDFRQVQM